MLRPLFRRLLLKGIQTTIHETLFQVCIQISYPLIGHDLFDGFHENFTVRFRLILQLWLQDFDDLGASNLQGNFTCSFDKLSVIFTIECVSSNPKVGEELRNYFVANESNFYSIRRNGLLDHFEYNLFHFIVIRGKFSYQNGRQKLSKLPSMFAFHQRYNEPNCFQKSCKCFSSVKRYSVHERDQN